jgi:shikimate kinase
MKMPGNIFLIGPMGSGKSTIGRHLAELLKMDFVDADHEVERRTGASIPLIFEIEGEDGFRRRETAVIDELTRKENVVLATGGGAVIAEANRRALHSRGTVVYLQAPLDTLFERTRKDRNRPLLHTEDPRTRLEALLREREPLYRQEADIIVDTDHRTPTSVAREIITKLKAGRTHENLSP